MIIGIVGFLWIIPWLIINKRKPNEHPWITDDERDYILSDNEKNSQNNEDEKSLSVAKILSFKESWGAISARFFI